MYYARFLRPMAVTSARSDLP